MKFCTFTLLMFTSVIAFCNVVPTFLCSATKGCSPLVVNMTDQSIGGVTSWHWDLGNGNTSTQKDPSATYVNPGTYSIKLIVSDGVISDSITKEVIVYGKPLVDFTSDRPTACANDSIIFSAQMISGNAPISRYAWGFGNGRGGDSVATSFKYDQAGIFDVTLVVLDTNGCTANITKPHFVQIFEIPVAASTVSPVISCGATQLVTLTDQSQGTGLSYAWNFGDSTSSNIQNPTHIYAYGKYRISLVVTNNHGCTSTSVQSVAIVNLQASFTADKLTACAGEAIRFTSVSPMPGTSWSWSFGDSGTSIKQNPQYIYNSPGVYSVKLVIREAFCTDSTTKVGYIHITPGFTLSFTPDHKTSCTIPFTVHFTSTASTHVSYQWDMGNGQQDSSANPTATYTTASVYSISLIATDTNGCRVVSSAPGLISTSKPLVKFTADTLLCPRQSSLFLNTTYQATHYVWHFGDGDSSTSINPHHTYRSNGRYTVSLRAIDSIGCDSILTKPNFVRVDSAQVDFRVDHAFSMCPPLVAAFKSIVNRSDIKLLWDFGDGYTDTAANPTHIFFQTGVYSVKLIGTTRQGCTDTISYPQLINVQGPSGTFSLTPDVGCTPLQVKFSGSVSGNTKSIACDLGDGLLLTDSLNFNYIYTTARTYHPKFILTDHVGCSIPFDLDSIIALPVPALSLQDTSVCAGQSVKINLGTDHYSWIGKTCDTCGRIPNVSDSSTVTVLTPSINTTYSVTATNSVGCKASKNFSIKVKQLEVLAARDTIKLCKDETARLNSVHADSVEWTPALYLDNAKNFAPVCQPPSSITYTLLAHTGAGCAISQQIPVRVIDKVTINLTKDTSVCPGSEVRLSASAIDSSMNGVSYSWSPSSALDNSNNASVITQLHSETQTFKVIATSGTCTRDTSTVTIVVRQSPSVKLPETVITTPHAEVPLTASSDELSSYVWSARDSLSCTDCRTTTLTPITSQAVYLSGTDAYGCVVTDSMLVTVLQCDPASIFVPNMFTPNGDGLHDILYLHSRTLEQLAYFRVFDRWGALVFESRNLSEGWDGIINGKAAPQGVYLFTITGKCNNGYDVEKNGTVTLVR